MGTELNLGDIVEAEVTRITDFGAFVKINGREQGLIHISQISDDFVKDVKRYLKVGDKLKARVIKLGPGKKIDLSLRKPAVRRLQKDSSGFARRQAGLPDGQTEFKFSDFEEKLKRFLKESQ